MLGWLLFLLVVLPFLAGAACLLPLGRARPWLVWATCLAVAAAAVTTSLGPDFTWQGGRVAGVSWHQAVMVLDLGLLAVFALVGLMRRHVLILVLALAQLGLILRLEFFTPGVGAGAAAHPPALAMDVLSRVMVLVVSLAGPLIVLYGLPYMRRHQAHRLAVGEPAGRGQGSFFAVMLLFLGAMNGLVLSADLTWLYFFFEVTTLCSWLLIGHDATPSARANALRALWMNSAGGLAFAAALVLGAGAWGGVGITEALPGSGSPAAMLALALLVVAGMVKAAQLPFQGWLLGAMVAPTPVSALLHSSTMVKAGVYIILRLSPALDNSLVAAGAALAGAFTFAVTAALAVSQSDAKKVLAYSTISNLGLIIAAAGLGGPLAMTVGLALVVFHAVTKGLLFLCVGVAQQETGSRDLEDLRGLAGRMPVLALMAAAGGLAMILPPFGMLLGKWLVLEAALADPHILFLLALGSALTVLYWARFSGVLLASTARGRARAEPRPVLLRLVPGAMFLAVLALSLAGPWLLDTLAIPVTRLHNATARAGAGPPALPGSVLLLYPLFPGAVLAAALGWLLARRTRRAEPSAIYVSGLNTPEPGFYTGPKNEPVRLTHGNHYLPAWFGESRLTLPAGVAALAILAFMTGGALW